jgi:hypothetical protein
LAEPTIGRIVHYVSAGSADGRYPSVCRAAIVTEVPVDYADDRKLTLYVVNPTGTHHAFGVPHNVNAVPYSWHWPERDSE